MKILQYGQDKFFLEAQGLTEASTLEALIKLVLSGEEVPIHLSNDISRGQSVTVIVKKSKK